MYFEVNLHPLIWIFLCAVFLVVLAMCSYVFVTSKPKSKQTTSTNMSVNKTNTISTRMATRYTVADSFIPSTKEYHIFQKYFSKLTRAITDPVIVAADLFSADLISEQALIKATTDNRSRDVKNRYLLDELSGALTLDPSTFIKIISVLECHRPHLSAIVEEMRTDYGIISNC